MDLFCGESFKAMLVKKHKYNSQWKYIKNFQRLHLKSPKCNKLKLFSLIKCVDGFFQLVVRLYSAKVMP